MRRQGLCRQQQGRAPFQQREQWRFGNAGANILNHQCPIRHAAFQSGGFDHLRTRLLGPHRRQMRLAAGGRANQHGRRRWPAWKGIDESHGPFIAGHDNEIGAALRTAGFEWKHQLGHATRRPPMAARNATTA